ncbi:MAG: glycosyltransferase family 4 protein [Rhodospirillaceae bacterium]|jgi:UDP-N-acetylmuramyl pentapeptide phosphotransferase/UDP-N-acetylglucosamine-1-phosphate transferase|nr:glycosyltransferase family 4 protein [Rhodospirillales bacterium]MBT3905142.1 glycosyltransferase family 4 protein [Rhodospirillaceae bacterium]MBT4702437.1 glycosyltransferase family 4 protein [Rhodospirillaceae bacterium]MBT5034843.1 glycosyltransferase family 4 protein [Rhodospirillaceae bacterium]MBT6219688.1 glycosyltransferase family 4 protein [Rhodospirillaceae bacterium]
MNLPLFAGIFVAVFLLSLGGTRLALGYLKQRAILDHPNERSSHTIPTPRGGGLAVSAVLIAAWAVLALTGFGNLPQILILCVVASGLAVLSWRDDLRPLPASLRLVGQVVAVSVALISAPNEAAYFGGFLPPILDTIAAGVLWIWFLNLFNFMDGIDGITATETIAVCVGVMLITAGATSGLFPYALVTTAAALGFLWWNWPPARIFLGDVGSIPLGFLLGWILLSLAQEGYGAAALILPAYYFADATLTLGRRAIRGERVWQAHKQHAYQRAVQRGWSHQSVVLAIMLTNLALVGLAVFATTNPSLTAQALIGTGVVVAGIIVVLQKVGGNKNL